MYTGGIFDTSAFGGVGLGLDVPVNGQVVSPSTSTNCGSLKVVQQMLNDLGYAAGPVDGIMGGQTDGALTDFAADHGLTHKKGSGAPPSGSLCQAMMDVWAAANAAPQTVPTLPPSSSGGGSTFNKANLAKTTGLISKLMANMPSSSAALSAQQQPSLFSDPSNWWASQSDTTKYAIIGGGLLAVGLAYYLLTKKPSRATANRRRRHRRRRARANPRRRSTRKRPLHCAAVKIRGCHCSKPKKYRHIPKRKFALPECYMYPLDTAKHVRAAASYFGKYKSMYPKSVQTRIKKKIRAAERRHGIGRR